MNFYDSLDMHRLLVADHVRTGAFRASILATVAEGATVLDVGAGSGILSLFAAQAGAHRVYAVERAPAAAGLARHLAAQNGFSEVITVIDLPMEAARLPESVDVIVSEWLGVFGVDENMLAPVLVARDRWLKPNGVMIPSSVTAWLAPVEHVAGHEAIEFSDRPYGLDLSALSAYSFDEAVWLPKGVEPHELLAEPQPMWTTDCLTMPATSASRPFAAELSFRLTKRGVNGVVAWFSAELPGVGILANAPGAPATHWGQFLFPIANAHAAPAGSELKIGFHNVPVPNAGSHHIWASRLEGEGRGSEERLEVHDTRRAWRAAGAPPWRVYQNGVHRR